MEEIRHQSQSGGHHPTPGFVPGAARRFVQGLGFQHRRHAVVNWQTHGYNQLDCRGNWFRCHFHVDFVLVLVTLGLFRQGLQAAAEGINLGLPTHPEPEVIGRTTIAEIGQIGFSGTFGLPLLSCPGLASSAIGEPPAIGPLARFRHGIIDPRMDGSGPSALGSQRPIASFRAGCLWFGAPARLRR